MQEGYYDWTKTKQPERPYIHQYHQTLVMKLFLCWKLANNNRYPNKIIDGSNVFLTFEEALEVIKKLDNITLGIPKIIYLVGWQHDGHDSKYPDWSVVNHRLKRPQDATALESLKWLMAEGFKYHTTLSLHINMLDAYENSPLWETYLKNDIIAKDKQGNLLKAEVFDIPNQVPRPETQGYYISFAREWETGFAQKRIEGLLQMLPIQKAGTIHIDAFHSLRPIPHAFPQSKYPYLSKDDKRISPFLNYSVEKEVEAQRKIFRYWRDHAVDVTSEGSDFLRPDPFIGLQPMAWHYNAPAPGIPPELYCGTPMQAEQEVMQYSHDLSKLVEKFCCNVVPWYYRNHKKDSTDLQGQFELGPKDFFLPAPWDPHLLILYRKFVVFQVKIYCLPPGWEQFREVQVSKITQNGSEPMGIYPIHGGKIKLRIPARVGVAIQPVNRS
jgi:hypothetical protein